MAGAAVTVRTYLAWETTATLCLLGGARGAGAPKGRRGAGHIVLPRAQLVVKQLLFRYRLILRSVIVIASLAKLFQMIIKTESTA